MARGSKGTSQDNKSILEYALGHLEREAAELKAKIDHVRSQIWGGPKAKAPAAATKAAATPAAAAPARKKRVLSAAARARISAAQKRRWAVHRKEQGGKA